MGPQLSAWRHSALARRTLKLSGEIVVSGANSKTQSGMAFMGAILTRFIVPALDTSSHERAALLVEFQAEQVSIVRAEGGAIPSRRRATTSTRWLCSGFRIEIGSLPCAHVMRIEALT
jgi:hypothetical protein